MPRKIMHFWGHRGPACGAAGGDESHIHAKVTCKNCLNTALFLSGEPAGTAGYDPDYTATYMPPKKSKSKKGDYESTYKSPYTNSYQSCYHTHPPYEIAPGITIYGGNGASPIHKDCDVYISLTDMRIPGPKSLPWNAGHDIVFPIKDFHVPDSASEFKKMIDWAAERLTVGDKMHVGCAMGHGRTGLVLVALRAVMVSPQMAIQHVRANYCKKAVDTTEQIEWLMKHFGVDRDKSRERGGTLLKGAGTGTVSTGLKTYGSVGANDYAPKSDGPVMFSDEWYRQPGESWDDWVQRTK